MDSIIFLNPDDTMTDQLRERLQKKLLLEKKIELQQGLPHLYGMPWYQWAWDFFASTNKDNFLCAANQISKSSTQIRKCIDWATDIKKWPTLWRRRPLQFWYLYPTRDVATIEFEKKWLAEWMPAGTYKDHPQYGWKSEYKNKLIWAIHFNSGVTVYFKTYGQDVSDLQTGSVDAIFCDEELPEDLYDELNLRRAATDGYFHMVFTATLGQEIWRETIEEKGKNEKFPEAFKQQVSMYDCLHYKDGSPSHWTTERIERIKNSCKSQAEVLRRVYGRFVVDSGLKYPSFQREKNIKPGHPLPESWHIYAGVDVGSGGKEGHPAAICFVGVSPDYRSARVFRGWRGDGEVTTAADVLSKYQELKTGLTITAAYYDWAAKDFLTIAQRLGESIVPAEKSHEIGEQIINVLFKNDMLAIYDYPELKPLVQELTTLQKSTNKTKAKDDFTDALRYAVTKIPWDWSVIKGAPTETPKPQMNPEIRARRGESDQESDLSVFINQEFDEWNDLYEI